MRRSDAIHFAILFNAALSALSCPIRLRTVKLASFHRSRSLRSELTVLHMMSMIFARAPVAPIMVNGSIIGRTEGRDVETMKRGGK